MKFQIKNTTTAQRRDQVVIVDAKLNLRGKACLTIVNEAIGNRDFPTNMRGQLMKFISTGLRDGKVKVFSGQMQNSVDGKDPQDRYLIELNTPITPYIFTTPQPSSESTPKPKTNTSGVCLKRYTEKLAQLYNDNEICPLTGVSEDQLLAITRASYRSFRVRTDEDMILETLK